jgi:peptidoglycan-associated lipoprotein
MNMVSIFRGAKFAAFVIAALAIAGCAKQQAEQTGLVGGAATPGSQQDFVVNVGDRVFFETDSSELTEQARATLDKQAQWLHHRRSCRRARHA